MDRSESSLDIRGVDDVLSHYGKKGMHWGVHKTDRSVPTDVVLKTVPGKLVKTSGGKFIPASADAKAAAAGRQMIKKSSIDVLSNKELQAVVTRMNLEQQYSNLKKNPRSNQDRVTNFVKKNGVKAGIVGFGAFKSDPKAKITKKLGMAVVKAAMSTQKGHDNNQKKKKKDNEDK